MDVSLILPCFNEEKIFEESVNRIVSVFQTTNFSYEIIFVDDGSSDGTQNLIKKTTYRAIFHANNQGRGKAVSDGIGAAKGTVVGYIDIDCEVSPVYIPEMVSIILQKNADIVIGKRFYRTSVKSLLREVLSRGYMWFADLVIGTGGLDTETGYKFFNRTKILPIIKNIDDTGWFWDTEIIVRSLRANLKIYELPVLFIRRFDKKSSVRVFQDIFDYVVNLWRLRKTV